MSVEMITEVPAKSSATLVSKPCKDAIRSCDRTSKVSAKTHLHLYIVTGSLSYSAWAL